MRRVRGDRSYTPARIAIEAAKVDQPIRYFGDHGLVERHFHRAHRAYDDARRELHVRRTCRCVRHCKYLLSVDGDEWASSFLDTFRSPPGRVADRYSAVTAPTSVCLRTNGWKVHAPSKKHPRPAGTRHLRCG